MGIRLLFRAKNYCAVISFCSAAANENTQTAVSHSQLTFRKNRLIKKRKNRKWLR